MMDWTVISAVVGATVTLSVAVGGLLLRAFVNPLKNRSELNVEVSKDHEERIRKLENTSSEHGVHLANLLVAVDRLVNKIDELVSFEKSSRRHRED